MIIGISGKIGSGKDEIGLCLAKNYNYTIIKFADKIKQIACLMTNTPMDLQTSQSGKATYLDEWGMTVREFQQKLGTDAVRDGLHKDAWVLATLSHYKPSFRWAVTDTRFFNEAEKIKNLKSVIPPIHEGGVTLLVEMSSESQAISS